MAEAVLSQAEHQRISEAIRRAEATTSGEIYCVLARTSDSYFFPAAFAVAVALLVTSLVAVVALDYWWVPLSPLLVVVAQLAAFAAMLGLIWAFPALRLPLVLRGIGYRRAHDNAVRQFLARNIHLTENRTGVLLFMSLGERYAAVLADAGINARVEQKRWDEVVELLIANAGAGRIGAGFEAAIAEVGAILSREFPRRDDDRNEIEDHLAEI